MMLVDVLADVQDLRELAIAAEADGEVTLAESLFRQAADIAPGNPAPLFNLGLFYQNRKRFESAIDLYRQVIALSPAFHSAWQNLGIVLLELGDPSAAEIHYLSYSKSFPKEHAAHTGLAHSLWMQGKFKSALKAIEQARLLKPLAADIHRLHALILGALNRNIEACTALLKAVSLYPDYADAHADLGDFYLGQNQTEKARQHFRQALSLNPQDRRAADGVWYANPGWRASLKGRSLALRPVVSADAPVIVNWQKSDLWNSFNRGRLDQLHKRLEGAEKSSVFVNRCAEWMVVHQGKPVGLVSLHDLNGTDKRAELQVGIFESPDQFAGFGVQAALILVEHAFAALGLGKIYCYVYAGNTLAQKTVESFGFVKDGVLRAHIIDPLTGLPLDIHVYSMLADEWRNNRRTQKLYERFAVPKIEEN